jgi:Mg-chelatase subunit ChlD
MLRMFRVRLSRRNCQGGRCRKGAIIVLTALFLVAIMAVLAMTIDLGYLLSARSELQRATDAGALAGAGAIVDGADVAQTKAFEFFARNPVGGTALYQPDNWQTLAEQWLAQHPDDFKMTLGNWDPTRPPGSDPTQDGRFYTDPNTLPSAIWLQTQRTDVPSFFARALGIDSFQVSAQAIARYQPRDIVLVLDFSGSMSYDSQLRRITDFGESARSAVESSLLQCYQDLGSPTYGSLTFQPQYVSATKAWSYGSPTKSGNVTVTFRSGDVQVNCTGTVSYTKIKLTYSNGTTKIYTTSGTSGTFAGTRQINTVTVYNGTNSISLSDDYTTIKSFFNLTSVPYPYPSGSWNSWIDYVKSSSYVNTAGYRKKYGCMTLINWWQESLNGYSQTPDLWKTHEQPVRTLKDACGTFFTFLQQVQTDDRVSFVIYNSPAQTAQIEEHLTTDMDVVLDTIQHRQAGHYDDFTNIGAGIQYGIQELDANGRAGAFKMIVLMTDGNANRPGGTSNAYNFTVQQAQAAAAKRYPILTICLGQLADSGLLQTVADTTTGYAFVVPGGASVTDYGPALIDVFQRIANARPLQIVK